MKTIAVKIVVFSIAVSAVFFTACGGGAANTAANNTNKANVAVVVNSNSVANNAK